MFSDVTVGAETRLKAIDVNMTARGQNGTSADVVSAINKLRKEIGNVGGNTYVIDGVNYTSGSDVADALETIIRTAVVGRRR